MNYWAEERKEIIVEVSTALENCKLWGLDLGYTMENIATADSDKLNNICVEVAEQLEKLQEFQKKLSALAYATEKM